MHVSHLNYSFFQFIYNCGKKRSVLGSSLYTCTYTTYTHYIESNEVDSVAFAAKINDIVILPLPIQAMPVIACQDRLLKPLNVCLK